MNATQTAILDALRGAWERDAETVERLDGTRIKARYVRHLRTLTPPLGDEDVALYRTWSGEEIEAGSPCCDGRAIPIEIG
jgi:hypothetical protein